MNTGAFENRRNILFRRPHPLSPTTTTKAGEKYRFAAHILMTTAATPSPTVYLRNHRSTIGAWVIRSCPESITTTRPEPLPPSFVDPMDFIGSCERRWKRNEVAESNKETAGDGLKKIQADDEVGPAVDSQRRFQVR